MKTIHLLFALTLVLAAASPSRGQVLTQFGTSGLNPVAALDVNTYITPWTVAFASQNTTSFTSNGESAFGGGGFGIDISSTPITIAETNIPQLSILLTGQATAANNPTDVLELTLNESNGHDQVFDFALGNWSNGSVDTVAGVYEAGSSSGNISAPVVSIVFNAGGGLSDTIHFQFDELQAVPEPSTYAMLGIGLLAIFGWQRRNKARQS
jgi:hypothetical protein